MLEATSRVSVSHIMIMGDFNYPAIDYKNGAVSASSTSVDYFFEKAKDLDQAMPLPSWIMSLPAKKISSMKLQR